MLHEQRVEILNNNIILAKSAAEKAKYLLNDMQDDYLFKADEFEIGPILQFAPEPGTCPEFENVIRWLCAYKSIMLRLDMIDDYMITMRDTLATAEEWETIEEAQ